MVFKRPAHCKSGVNMKNNLTALNLSFIRRNPISSLIALVLLIAAVKLYSLNTRADADDGRWQQFKQDHHCQLQSSAKENERLSWRCDDGQVYYGWRQQR